MEVLEIQKQKESSSSAGGGDTNDALLNAEEEQAMVGDEIDTNLQYRALTRIGVKKMNFQMFDKQLNYKFVLTTNIQFCLQIKTRKLILFLALFYRMESKFLFELFI